MSDKKHIDTYKEGLDARVFHPVTNLIPASPLSSDAQTEFSSILPPGSKPFTVASEKWGHFISLAKTKRLNQLNTAKDVQTSKHLPSKYALTYEVEKFKKNRMIIFNHSHFRDVSTRYGTMLDEMALEKTFTSFGFDVDIHRDLHKRELIDTIRKFSESDFSEYGCICVTVLTHGADRPGYLEAYDRRYRESEIFEPFDASRNRSLAAKPIVFIIQACRGDRASMLVNATRGRPRLELDHGVDYFEDYHIPIEADRIIFHSSTLGKASIRHPEHGSWFIQALCRNIQQYSDIHDLETIFRMVRREVALDYVTSKDWKQMPVVTSTLLRELYLGRKGQDTPDKDKMDYKMRSITCEYHQQRNPKEAVSIQELDESPDSSLTLLQPFQMPCSCFLEYFEYLKNCMQGFVHHNPEDPVASTLLKMMKILGDGAEYNVQKFTFMQCAWEHFDANMDKFPAESAKFVYRKYF